MKIKVNIKYGDATYQFEIDEADEKEALNKAITFGNPPRYCLLCKNTDQFKFTSNKDKEGNIYVNAKCIKCDARAKLGEYRSKGFFWHEFSIYKGKVTRTTSQDESDIDVDFPNRD